MFARQCGLPLFTSSPPPVGRDEPPSASLHLISPSIAPKASSCIMSSPTYSRKAGTSPSLADHRDEEDEWSEDEGDDGTGSRKRQRTAARPISVSCELCKQRKVKCDRGHPTCGWCQRNNQLCEYKERKKPGLRAGYGRVSSRLVVYLDHTLMDEGTRVAS